MADQGSGKRNDGEDGPDGQAGAFGVAAAEYERGRPPYPLEAVDWLVPEGARRVLDLGAGTGKLTRLLRHRGLDVVAVEPSEGMRQELHRVLPDVPVLAGSAEAIPLDDGAVDAVLVAQAWHWVDTDRAVPEVARVLAPGGTLGLLWNIRDERDDWVRQLGLLLARYTKPNMHTAAPPVGPPFGPLERRDVEWIYNLTPGALIDLVTSRSYIITLPPDEHAAVLGQVRTLLNTHPALAGRQQIALPYVSRCSRTVLQL